MPAGSLRTLAIVLWRRQRPSLVPVSAERRCWGTTPQVPSGDGVAGVLLGRLFLCRSQAPARRLLAVGVCVAAIVAQLVLHYGGSSADDADRESRLMRRL